MLPAEDRTLLDLAGRFWRHGGSLEQAAREQLGLTPVRYWQRVNALLRTQEAAEYAPRTVAALRRRRGQ